MQLQPDKKPEIKEERSYNHNDPIQTAIHTGDWSHTAYRPNKKCKQCHGTGNLGYNIALRKYVACNCVKYDKTKELSQV